MQRYGTANPDRASLSQTANLTEDVDEYNKRMKYIKKRLLQDLMTEDSGQDLVEYALIVGLVGLSIVSLVHGIATGIANDLNLIGTRLTTDA